jgi:type I restriction enzyme, S subunit
MVRESISDGWELTTLSQVCKIRNIENNSSELYVGLEHIGKGNNLLIGSGHIKDFKSNKNSFQKNDILYGKLRPNLNKVCLATENGYCSTDILPLQINDKVINTFLLQIISSFKFVNYAISLSSGTKMPRIKWNDIKNFELLLPTIPEQKKIEQIILDVNELLYQISELIKKKKNIHQGAMQELLTGKRRLRGFNEKWEEKTLKDIVEIPISDGPHETPKFLRDGIPFLSVNNIAHNQIDLSSLRYISTEDHIIFSKKCKPQKGDILLGKAASVGHVAIIDFSFEFNIWSPLALIRINNNNIGKFIYYYIQTKHIKNQIIFLTHSSSQGNLGMGEMEKLEFLLPLKKEQSSIAQILSDMDSEIQELESKRDKYLMIKNGMMQKLLTGEIRLT